jgi:hypothetical protein
MDIHQPSQQRNEPLDGTAAAVASCRLALFRVPSAWHGMAWASSANNALRAAADPSTTQRKAANGRGVNVRPGQAMT